MTPQEFKTRFPNATRSVMEANGIGGDAKCTDCLVAKPAMSSAAPEFKPLRAAKGPNKTEAEFGLRLEAQLRRGEVDDYRYEGLTLRWGGGMRYTPDWVVWMNYELAASDKRIVIVEVKGGHIFDRDLVRFKGCRAEWKDHFDFEMHQKKKGEWRRLL